MSGRTIELTINPGDTILDVKKQIEVEEGIPIRQQTLIHAGKALENKRFYCADREGGAIRKDRGPVGYGLGDNVTLHLLINATEGAT